jgi:hypothetical protein
MLLTYRHGRYREDRDNFLLKRSVGFFCPVVYDDLTLFDQADHGIVESGVRALTVDLNLDTHAQLGRRAELKCFVCASHDNTPNLLGLVTFQAPECSNIYSSVGDQRPRVARHSGPTKSL